MNIDYGKYSIKRIRNIIDNIEIQNLYKFNSKDFTRKRKMNFANVALCNLNKRGLTNKMEIVELYRLRW